MKFQLYTLCGYPSYEEAGTKWNDNDYKAHHLVKGVKRQPFNGYAMVAGQRVDNTPGGFARALSLAAGAIAATLRKAGHSSGCLVPIPSSSHTAFGEVFTGSRLVEAIAAADENYAAAPVLRFKESMKKASSGGGTRSAAAIACSLALDPSFKKKTCILIDDVASTGGHLVGSARFLETQGVEVIAAACVAQTVWARPANIFSIAPRELDTEPDYFEF